MELDVTLYRHGEQISHILARFPASHHFIGLFGESGVGKSTLLHGLSGTYKDIQGRFTWGDLTLPLTQTNPHTTMMLQSPVMFPGLTVMQQLDLVSQHAKGSGRSLREVIQGLAIGDLLDKSGSQLSGGEIQRVAIARTLMTQAKVALLDEPVSALDNVNKRAVLQFLREVCEKTGLRIIMVSHDVDELACFCDGLMKMDNGLISAFGAVESVLQQHFRQHPELVRFSILSGVHAPHLDKNGLVCLIINDSPIYTRESLIKDGVGTITVYANQVLADRSALPHTSLPNSVNGVISEVTAINENLFILSVRVDNTLLYCQIHNLVQEKQKFSVDEAITLRFDVL